MCKRIRSYFKKLELLFKFLKSTSKSTGNTNTFLNFFSQSSALAWSETRQTPPFLNMQFYSSSYKNRSLTKE